MLQESTHDDGVLIKQHSQHSSGPCVTKCSLCSRDSYPHGDLLTFQQTFGILDTGWHPLPVLMSYHKRPMTDDNVYF